MRLTPKNITAQALEAEPGTLVHWEGAKAGECERKDSGIDTAESVCKEATVTFLCVASYYGNITCLRCRKLAWAKGVR